LAMTSSRSSTNILSVSSSFRLCGLAPVRSSMLSTFCAKSGLSNCRALIFTATVRWAVSFRAVHAAICRQAVSSTQSPNDRINPVCSARGMKSSGGRSPRFGCFHRSNASAPIKTPRSTCGAILSRNFQSLSRPLVGRKVSSLMGKGTLSSGPNPA